MLTGLTLRPVPLSLPARAFRRVVLPEEGGPSSSVRRPGRMVPLRPLRMLMRFLVLRMIRSFCSTPCNPAHGCVGTALLYLQAALR